MSDHYLLASRLKTRIMFQKKERTRLFDGTFDELWLDALTRKTWAEVLTIGGEEGRVAASESQQVRYRITLRRRHDIDPAMRIILPSGAPVEILSIRDPDGRGVYLEINGLEKQGAV